MFSMLCSLWDKFSMWVTNEWNNTTYIIVICAFSLFGLYALLAFFKKSFDKGKRPKWGMLILAILMFALVAVVSAARFTK